MSNPDRLKPVCAHCGSDDVTIDSVSRWDVDKQEWLQSDVYDDTFCGACECECKIRWETAE